MIGTITSWSRRAAMFLGVLGAVALCTGSVVSSGEARADDGAENVELVTYEVVSDRITAANIQWQDDTGRRFASWAALPWRVDVHMREPLRPPPEGSQIRADWRPHAFPGIWVTVRIIYRGEVICQNVLDVGNAACYGVTRRVT